MDRTTGQQDSRRSDRAPAQEQLNQTEKMRLMGEMASGVVHDFNNILGAIIGRAQLSLRKSDIDEIKRNLTQIEQIALQGGETVKRLQAFIRRENRMGFRPVDLSDVVKEALEVTRHRWETQAQQQGIVYHIERQPCGQGIVMGARSELIDVVTNLIFNALDAMPDGGILKIATCPDGDRCRMVVSDSGIGMMSDQIEQIFYPFYTTKGSQGTGLGLAVAYGIISRHGGEIRAESTVGEGTRIIIELPGTGQREQGVDAPPPVSDSTSRRVLLVDDDHTILDVMGEALREVGHDVTTFDNGAEAIVAIQSDAFDVVITDLGMPGITGWEVARQAQAHKPRLPVVVISGWGAQMQDGEHEVDAVLAKPFHLDQLRATITRVTRQDSTS